MRRLRGCGRPFPEHGPDLPVFQPRGDAQEAVQQPGIEDAALAVQNHRNGLRVRIRGLVHALAGQRIVHVRQ